MKEPWLVNGLFEAYGQLRSPRLLEVLLNVRDPHDRFLFDRLSDSIKPCQGKQQRELGLEVLGYVVRKQPVWLYRIAQHPLMKDLIRVLKVLELDHNFRLVIDPVVLDDKIDLYAQPTYNYH